MKKIIYIAIFSLFCAVVVPTASFAYEKTKIDVPAQNDFVVEPGKTEIIVNPGETVTKNISVISRVDHPVHFTLSTEDLVGSDDPNQTVVLLGNEKGPYSLKNLITPEISDFTLSLGEKITIPVTVSVPKDAEPRGYYGALIVANDPQLPNGTNASEAQGQTRIISRIGSLFLVKVKGEGVESGELKDFKLMDPAHAIYASHPAGFEIAYKNTGTVHLVPYGTITIKNTFGKKIATLPVDAYFVLPDSTRYRQISWEAGFGIGRYTAELSLYKGYGDQTETAKVSFWILPWKILLGLFAIIVVVVAIVYYISVRFEIRRKH